MSQENAKLVLDVISVIEHRDPQRSRSAGHGLRDMLDPRTPSRSDSGRGYPTTF